MTDLLPSLSWVDWALLALLSASVLIGLVRGLVFECLSLAGWVAAWFAAQWAAPQVAPHLPLGGVGSALNLGAAFALCFVAALVIWGLLARLVRMLIRATPLSLPDRLLGAAFGALRGAVLLLALATVVTLTPAAQSTPWRQSQGAKWLAQALHGLKPLLPEMAVSRLPA
ncbi:MAG: CvpA family protein [Rubrivivax sp.]|nr:CvpA family protein [Rubrivivax sp.]